MKKAFSLLTLLALTGLTLASCNTEGPASEPSSTPSSPVSSTSSPSSSSQPSSVDSSVEVPDKDSSSSTSTSDGDDDGGDGDISVPDPAEELNEALNQDYSNSTVFGEVVTSSGDFDSSFYVYNTQGYNIVDDRVSGEEPLLYYHDYEGESYLWFEDNYGNGPAWLSYALADVGLEKTYWRYNYSIPRLTTDEFSYDLGVYWVEDEYLDTFVSDVFKGYALIPEGDISYGYVIVEDGYLSQLVGVVNENSYVRISIGEIGTTAETFDVPEAPNEDNVKTWEEYSGQKPVDKTVKSLSLTFKGEEKTELQIEDEVNLYLDVDPYEAFDANSEVTHLVSTNPDVIDLSYDFDDDASDTKKVLKVTALKEGESDVYVEVNNEDGSTVKSNAIHFTVDPLKSESLEGEKLFDLSFVSIDGDNDDQTVTVTNAVPSHAVTARGSNLELADPRYGTNQFEEGKNILKLDPTDAMNGTKTYLELDFGSQEVSGLAFYYGLIFDSHESNIWRLDRFQVQLQDESGEWIVDSDLTQKVKDEISGDNLKLAEIELSHPATKVRIETHSSTIGNSLSIGLQSLRAYADESCRSDVPQQVKLESVSLKDSYSVEEGKTVQVTPVVTPMDADSVSFQYRIEDERIATVDESGLVHGLKAGTTTLTVAAVQRNKAVTDTATITVTEPYKTLKGIKAQDVRIELGDQTEHRIEVETDPLDAPDVTLFYSSSNTAVCTVGSDGVINAYNTLGTSTITITARQNGIELTTTCTVEVYADLPRELDRGYVGTYEGSYQYGEDLKLTVLDTTHISLETSAQTYDATFNEAIDLQTFEFLTSDNIAIELEVTEGDYDSVWVRSSDLDIYPILEEDQPLKRLVEVQSVEITNGDLTLAPNETAELDVVVNPSNATHRKDLEFSSDNEGVATVTSDGVVVAHSEGTANITVKCESATDTIRVTVEGEGTDISALNGTWANDDGDQVTIEDGHLTIDYDATNGMFDYCEYDFDHMDGDSYVFVESYAFYYMDAYVTLDGDELTVEWPDMGSYIENLYLI